MEPTDASLVKAACSGDVDAFRRLYERHYRLAVGIARTRLRDQHLAEDAAQEAFAVVCRKLHTLRNGDRFPEWLGTICRRTANKMARRQVNGMPVIDDPAKQLTCEESGSATLHSTLDQLPRKSREVLLLHYFSGLSYEEIARSLGVSPQAVHGRMQRARRMLARRLKEEG